VSGEDLPVRRLRVQRAILNVAMANHQMRVEAASDIPNATVLAALADRTLIHGRALIEFLLGPKKGQIHRSDFLPGWTPPRSPERRRLEETQRHISNYLVHLLEQPQG
jgi:hypothetical protein